MRPCPVGVDGMLGRSGPMPQGYYKDPVKTAATFREVDGVRWSIPGDFARREEDGSITVLGRGSVCINTGGEKVHPEEVEAVLLRHDDVFDVAVVGTARALGPAGHRTGAGPRRRGPVTADDLRGFARTLISNYKVPKEIFFVPEVPRTAVSKVDYRASAELAVSLVSWVAVSASAGRSRRDRPALSRQRQPSSGATDRTTLSSTCAL